MKPKTFDCVKMKHDIQQHILQEWADLSLQQRRAKTEESIKSDPILARWWRRAKQAGTDATSMRR